MGDEGEEKPPEPEEPAAPPAEPPAEAPPEPAPEAPPPEAPPAEPPQQEEAKPEEKPPEEPVKPPEPDEAPAKEEEAPKPAEEPAPPPGEEADAQEKRMSKAVEEGVEKRMSKLLGDSVGPRMSKAVQEGLEKRQSKAAEQAKAVEEAAKAAQQEEPEKTGEETQEKRPSKEPGEPEPEGEKKGSDERLSTVKEKSKTEVEASKSRSDSKIEKSKSDSKVPSGTRVSKGSVHSGREKEGRMTSLSKISEAEEEKEMKPSRSIISSQSLDKSRSLVDTKDRTSRTERLGSKAQKVVGSIISIRRLSGTGDLYDRGKGARFANTYKLESDKPFNHEEVEKILENVMEEALENLTYCPDKCPKQAKWASSAIRAKVKELQYDRYKMICLVTIGEKNSQDVLIACRFLWDAERDTYATYCAENTFVFGIAQCFGIYYE